MPLIHPKTVQNWVSRFLSEGIVPGEGAATTHGGISKGARKVLVKIADSHPEFYLDEFAAALQQRLPRLKGAYSEGAISRALRFEGYSWQKLQLKAAQRCDYERARFRHALRGVPARCLLFLDESSTDPDVFRRRRGWSRSGKAPIRFKFKNFDVGHTLFGACNLRGFEMRCVKVEQGNIDRNHFVEYFRDIVVPCLGRFDLLEENSVVVLDNAPTHQTPELRRLAASVGAVLVFLAPYSPDANPIEEAFGWIKRWLQRHDAWSQLDPHFALLEGCRQMNAARIRPFFRHAGYLAAEDVASGRKRRAAAAGAAVVVAATTTVLKRARRS